MTILDVFPNSEEVKCDNCKTTSTIPKGEWMANCTFCSKFVLKKPPTGMKYIEMSCCEFYLPLDINAARFECFFCFATHKIESDGLRHWTEEKRIHSDCATARRALEKLLESIRNTKELKALKKNNKALEKENAKLERISGEQKATAAELKRKVEMLNVELNQFKEEKRDMRGIWEISQKEVKTMKDELEKAKKANKEMEDEINGLKAELENMKGLKMDLNAENKTRTEALEGTTKASEADDLEQNNKMKEELEATAKADEVKSAVVETMDNNLKEELNKEREKTTMFERMKTLEMELGTAEEAIKALLGQVKKMNEENEHLEMVNKEKEDLIKFFKEQQKVLSASILHLTSSSRVTEMVQKEVSEEQTD